MLFQLRLGVSRNADSFMDRRSTTIGVRHSNRLRVDRRCPLIRKDQLLVLTIGFSSFFPPLVPFLEALLTFLEPREVFIHDLPSVYPR